MLLFPTILQAVLEGLFPEFLLPFFATFGPFALFQDLIIVAVIVGVCYGLYYRVVVKPKRYEGSHQAEGNLVLVFILTIMVTLIVYNGVQQNLGHAHIAATWQPVSALAGQLFSDMAEDTQRLIGTTCWWIHLGVVLVFLTLLPIGKHFHVVTSAFNILLRNLEPRGRLAPIVREDGQEGTGRVEQFTWRQMLDWYTCSECGRCQDVCPAYTSGTPLSPKKLIMGLRAHLYERGNALLSNGQASAAQSAVLDKQLTGDVIQDDVLWACTTCYACDQECPLFVEHVQPVVDMRRYMLTQQRADTMLTGAMENLRRYGNSFGKSDKQRAKWIQGLGFKPKDIRKEPAQYLWFVGDYASYSPALTDITQATSPRVQAVGG